MGINSLGIGSGVLTADLIDQLREADDNILIKPLEKKIELANQKEDAYDILSSLMSTFKSSAANLDGDSLYLGRVVSGDTDAVSVTAESGSNLQNFTITDISKAQEDVWNSTTFSSSSATFSGISDGTLTIGSGDNSFELEYTTASSLEDIRDAINEEVGDEMTASILKVGSDSYQLIITSDETNKEISFSDSNSGKQLNTVSLTNDFALGDTFTWTDGLGTATLDQDDIGLADGDTSTEAGVKIADAINNNADLKLLYKATAVDGGFTIEALDANTPFTSTFGGTYANTEVTTNAAAADTSLVTALGLNNIQDAKAATFNFNGVEITRDTNEITDLITGVTITLNQDQEATDSASIKIEQNNTAISSEMALFVNGFNSLNTNLQDMTKSDRDSGAVGIFQGESFVKSISRDLIDIITNVNSKGESLVDYGISIDRSGEMSLDNSVFADKFVKDPAAMELFFSGNSTTDGLFTTLNNKMTEYTGYNKLLSTFSDKIDNEKTSLTTQYDKQKASLDSRYEIMTKKFIAYDAVISRINSQFASLQMMIDAEANAN